MQFNASLKITYYDKKRKQCILTEQPCWKHGFNCEFCKVVMNYYIKPELKNAVVTEEFLQKINAAQQKEETEMNEIIAARNKPFKKESFISKILKLFKF
jgi:hypothetical protein